MGRPGSDRDSPTEQTKPPQDSPLGHTGADRSTLSDDLETARLTIAQMEARLEERAALVYAAEAERDRWRAQVERLTELLAAREAPPPTAAPYVSPSRRWWPWRRG